MIMVMASHDIQNVHKLKTLHLGLENSALTLTTPSAWFSQAT